jgi:hypothetical protein
VPFEKIASSESVTFLTLNFPVVAESPGYGTEKSTWVSRPEACLYSDAAAAHTPAVLGCESAVIPCHSEIYRLSLEIQRDSLYY